MQAVIITGDSRGLGEAIAADLLERGCTVIGVSRSKSGLLKGERYRHIACDLSLTTQIGPVVLPGLHRLAAEKPTAVTLINNAAVATPVGHIGRLAAEDIVVAFAINIAAPLVMADLFFRAFPGPGTARRIINVSSGGAQRAVPGSAPYSMAKAALEMLTRAVVADHGDASLECISLRPGIFDTAMQEYMRSRDPVEFPSVALFRGFAEQGLLKAPAEVARRIVTKLVLAPVENGRTYTHADLDE